MQAASQVYLIELLLFYVLAFGILFLPIRWSLLCLLLAGNVAVNPSSFVSASSVSWQNAVETLVLPAFLLLRLTRFRLPKIAWTFPSKAWAVLVFYAAVSVFWSPFKLSGLKMVAYLAAWFVLYLVFDLCWQSRLLDQKLVVAALWGGLALACLQTYVLGNPLYGAQDHPGQFVSAQFAPFRGPQFFGPFLACLLSLLLFSRERHAFRLVSIVACLYAIVLVGSRYALIEAGIVTFVWWLLKAKAVRAKGTVRLGRVLPILLFVVVLFVGFRAAIGWAMPKSRVNQLLELGSNPQVVEEGDFGWRLLVYGRVMRALTSRSLGQLAIGSGTSSGGEVAIKDLNVPLEEGDMDPNRTIHDEFLRAEYEWGVVGLGIGFGLLIYTLRELRRRAFLLRSLASFAALSILPGIVLALLVENPLAGPSSSEGLGYLLVLTYGFYFVRPPRPSQLESNRTSY